MHDSIEIPNKFSACPGCNTLLDAALCVTDEHVRPVEGDISICATCGILLEYEEGLFVHELSKDKLEAFKIADIKSYTHLLAVQELIKSDIKEYGRQEE